MNHRLKKWIPYHSRMEFKSNNNAVYSEIPITRISYNISKETRIRFLGFFNPFIVLIHIIFSILSVTNQNLLFISLYPFPFQSAIPYSFFSCFPCLFKEKTTFCILFELFLIFFDINTDFSVLLV